jgi:hypothetical protein
LLLHRLGKMLTHVSDLPFACFELLFEISAALSRLGLASRFSQLAVSVGASSHCVPKG